MPGSLAGVSCLVTGAGGFLGQRIVELLMLEEVELGEIRMLDIAYSPKLQKTCDDYLGSTTLKLLKGDVLDSELRKIALEGVTLVIHTAVVIDVTGTVSRERVMAVNVKGTQVLLEACKEMNVNYFIYTSSFAVVGPNNRGDPIIDGSEDLGYSSSRFSLPYALSKKTAEQLVLLENGQQLKNGSRLVTCALRSTYMFGEDSHFLQFDLDDAIKNKDVFLRLSKKEALVNPVYVGNVAWAHIQAAKAMMDPEQVSQVAGHFYYISDDTPHMSYSDFNYELGKDIGFGVQPKLRMPLLLLYYIAFLLEIISILLRPIVNFVPPIHRQMINMYNTTFTFSYKKATKDFGYKPCNSWSYSKSATVGWMTDQVPQRREFLKQHKQL